MRLLTMRFGTYNIGKYEKETGKGVMDLLDIGNLELNKIALLIRLGNPGMSEEDAYQRFDNYLTSDEEHSIITAFFDLIDEMDKDLKILKSCGIKVKDLKEEFLEATRKGIDKTGLTNPKELVESVE